ncbi:MAG: hypothetical protein ACRDWI_03885 [Jiangellaceae bacterium]
MGAVDRAKRGLTRIGGAAALVEIGRQLWPAVKPTVERGRDNALAWRTARAHARRVRDGSYLDVFVDGVKHWVVWSGGDPVAAYPPVDGDLTHAVRMVDLDQRRRPGRSHSGTRSSERRRLPGDHW